MTDVLTSEQRRRCMAAIRSRDTSPERAVRGMVRAMGWRYRLGVSVGAGTVRVRPDLVLPGRRAIFVHGCFWHMHLSRRCGRFTFPDTRRSYWEPKLLANRKRDQRATRALRRAGWRVMTVWECELSKPDVLLRRLRRFLG